MKSEIIEIMKKEIEGIVPGHTLGATIVGIDEAADKIITLLKLKVPADIAVVKAFDEKGDNDPG